VRGETVRLVRKYLACLDELRVLNSVVSNKIKLLRGLAQDAAKFEEDYAAEGLDECNDPMVDSMQKRVEWALKQQEAEEKDIKVLVNHMEKALEEVSCAKDSPASAEQVTNHLFLSGWIALPSPLHRAKRTRHRCRQPEQGYFGFHRRYRHLPAVVLLHLVLRHESHRPRPRTR